VNSDDLERRLERAFSKKIRLAAENSAGQFSSVWMFWGNKNDFYFGSKSLLSSFKVSLHENGIGYVAYHKSFFLAKRAGGFDLPNKTTLEWKLPVPGQKSRFSLVIQHQRYAHAKQFKRANRMLKKLRTYLGRVIRDIGRKIEGDGGLEAAFAELLLLARRVREQQPRQRGPKVYSLHAPEVECIGKGKAHRPYEFGVKVSVATTISHAKGGQFVTHVKALPGNPYDGHTLATVIPDMEAMVGNTLERILTDKGYRGHNAPPAYKFRVFISGQKRGVTPAIKRQLRRRSAVEPVIGHLKAEHRMGRNYLWYRRGDAANAVLAAVGYNFRRLIRWLRLLLCQILGAVIAALQPVPA
jgi:IS5 family transposase